jgi:hypothetical protein
VVDGMMGDTPTVESLDTNRLRDERFARLGLDWDHVSVADLRIGTFVDTCDLVEHWFGTLQT